MEALLASGVASLLLDLLLGDLLDERRRVTTIHSSSARSAASPFFPLYSLMNLARPDMDLSSLGLGYGENLHWYLSSNLAGAGILSCFSLCRMAAGFSLPMMCSTSSSTTNRSGFTL